MIIFLLRIKKKYLKKKDRTQNRNKQKCNNFYVVPESKFDRGLIFVSLSFLSLAFFFSLKRFLSGIYISELTPPPQKKTKNKTKQKQKPKKKKKKEPNKQKTK